MYKRSSEPGEDGASCTGDEEREWVGVVTGEVKFAAG